MSIQTPRNNPPPRRRVSRTLGLLEEKVAELKAEQQQSLERCAGLEEQNSVLTTLYVASQRLHSTLDRSQVLQMVREIIANLIGCEEYVLFNLNPDGLLHHVDSWGLDSERYQLLPRSGVIGRVVDTGEAFFVHDGDASHTTPLEASLTACIPLKRNDAVTGAIALFRLLPQKFELQELDRELFRLLETHLALALHCTELELYAGTKIGVTA
jgi:GAF domain-containing protein